MICSRNWKKIIAYYLEKVDIWCDWFGDKALVSPSLVLRMIVGCEEVSWAPWYLLLVLWSLSFSLLAESTDVGFKLDFSSLS